MKKNYELKDFNTHYSRTRFESIEGGVDYGLLKKYSDPASRAAIFKRIPELLAEKDENANTPDEGSWAMQLPDGRNISHEEIMRYVTSEGSKRILDSLYIFEKIFREHKTAEHALDVLAGRRKSINRDNFEAFLRVFPMEATLIRTEIIFPDIRKNNDLYLLIMTNQLNNLSGPFIIPTSTGPKAYPPLGAEEGPRIPPLAPEKIQMLLSFWAGSDLTLKPIIDEITQSPNYGRPDPSAN